MEFTLDNRLDWATNRLIALHSLSFDVYNNTFRDLRNRFTSAGVLLVKQMRRVRLYDTVGPEIARLAKKPTITCKFM